MICKLAARWAACALACAPVIANAQAGVTTVQVTPQSPAQYPTPTVAGNPACPNAGGTGVAGPGIVGASYGGTVCPAQAGAGGGGSGGTVTQGAAGTSPWPVVSIAGQGGTTTLPAGTTNGTLITAGAVGVRLYANPGCTIKYAIATSAPTSAPAFQLTFSNPSSATSFISADENLTGGAGLYVTSPTTANGACGFRPY